MAGPNGEFCDNAKGVCIEITYANESTGKMKGILKENGYHYTVNGWYQHVNPSLTRIEFTTENSGVKDTWLGNAGRPCTEIWAIRSYKIEDGSSAAEEYTLTKK
ncbi:hypothetical protein [Pseudomonas sp. BGI-2]|uniref:hypothetical protein n=1 Tax=Pseudomonas sp. BGI-2 TaxID=2528211 RepID=UPI0010354616|nr:hypothetical protein [Pseudomonas sp. BGI-2]TBN46551.1 hypothetical protein EYC95_12390 [Pseudomonas sp. BGI-2]